MKKCKWRILENETKYCCKKLWEKCVEIQNEIGVSASYGHAPLYSYPGILTMYAGAQAAKALDDDKLLEEVNSYLELYPFRFEEPGIKFAYNFDNYRVGGLGKAWMFMKGYFKDHENVIREYAEMTLVAPKSSDGIMCDRRWPELEKIWVDVVYAVCPFMLFAGLSLKEPRYVDFAVDQCFKMYDAFIDKSNGLLHQARGFMGDKTTLSHDHWSRGNGWGIIGLVEIVRYIPKEHPKYDEACKRLYNHCASLIKFQTERGLWKQSIAERLAWEESSGTGLILYAIGIGLRVGVLDKETFMEPFKRGIEGLYQFCIEDDYSVTRGCHGCLCPGLGDKKGTIEAYLVDVTHVKNDSHAFGPIILAMTEAERNGIGNIVK